jgi:hypothetical protein
MQMSAESQGIMAEPKRTRRGYFSTSDLATIAIFAAIQFVLQFFAGRITFLPGAERPLVALPVAFLAALTYLRTRKVGAVGMTILIAGIIQVILSGFPPVIFEFVGGALGAEMVIAAAHTTKGRCGTFALCLATSALMLGRGIGVTSGLLIFLPAVVFKNFASQALVAMYVFFNGLVPFMVAPLGAWAAIKLSSKMKLAPGSV